MAWRDKIVNFFKRDKVIRSAVKGRGSSSGGGRSGGGGGGGSSSAAPFGLEQLSDLLNTNTSLLERYADYEAMDDYPELQTGLDIYADDSTITDNVRGKTIWAVSQDKVIRDIIDDLLHRILRIEDEIWIGVRTLCKYGNAFAEIVVTESGVVGLNFLPVATMRRLVDNKGNLLGYVQDLSGGFNIKTNGVDAQSVAGFKKQIAESGMVFFESWEIIHWRLRSKHTQSLYGYSIEDAARWIWKRLVLIEDTALAYKLTRSPSRYAFYVDTGDLPPEESMAQVRMARQAYKKRKIVNPATGQLDFRNNVLSPEDDMWIPTRGGKESTRVEVLSGPDWASTEIMEYLRDKMFTAIKIPRSYFGGDAEADTALAQKDVRFARTCLRIQREWRNGMRHVIRVHLAALGIDPDSIPWETRMTAPSSIFELQQIEVMNAQAGLMETLSNWFDTSWLLQRVLGFAEDDAAKVVVASKEEKERMAQDAASLESKLASQYPGSDVDVDAQENIDVSTKLDKLMEGVDNILKVSGSKRSDFADKLKG